MANLFWKILLMQLKHFSFRRWQHRCEFTNSDVWWIMPILSILSQCFFRNSMFFTCCWYGYTIFLNLPDNIIQSFSGILVFSLRNIVWHHLKKASTSKNYFTHCVLADFPRGMKFLFSLTWNIHTKFITHNLKKDTQNSVLKFLFITNSIFFFFFHLLKLSFQNTKSHTVQACALCQLLAKERSERSDAVK